MALETKEEIVSFLKTYRQLFANKTGFKHLTGQFSEIIDFIEKLSAENERLRSENSSQ